MTGSIRCFPGAGRLALSGVEVSRSVRNELFRSSTINITTYTPRTNMKKLTTLGVTLLIAVLGYYQQHNATGVTTQQNHSGPVEQTGHSNSRDAASTEQAIDQGIEQAIEQRRSDAHVTAQGSVKKTLSDDNDGSRHQRFLVELPSGHTILVAHNIDLAERVPDLQPGDHIELHGEYVWNERGGVMHWTHRDPSGRHAAGWIKHNGHVYQ
jgi:Protein of unknown function (DUF3465)